MGVGDDEKSGAGRIGRTNRTRWLRAGKNRPVDKAQADSLTSAVRETEEQKSKLRGAGYPGKGAGGGEGARWEREQGGPKESDGTHRPSADA